VSSDKQISLLRQSLPDWATLGIKNLSLQVTARVPRPNGGFWPQVSLEISTSGEGKLQAREQPSQRWPEFCSQRHINEGGFFCLGLSDVPVVSSGDDAARWWRILAAHLQMQFVAELTKTWPKDMEWDHGEAGETQYVMESIAQKHELIDDVRNAHRYGQGWLSGELPRLTKAGDRLINGRAPCPRGCRSRKHPILRRACRKRQAIYELVKLERVKRIQSAEFWKACEGKLCCGHMLTCPMKKD
jgi:hypothetical protein